MIASMLVAGVQVAPVAAPELIANSAVSPQTKPSTTESCRLFTVNSFRKGPPRAWPGGEKVASLTLIQLTVRCRRAGLRRTIWSGASVRDMPSELIHTCYRIGEIDRSIAFYNALGFEELRRMPIGDEATNIFMGLPGDGPRLELTYNHGVGSYEIGTGYGHIAITTGDLAAMLARLAALGIEPEKPPYRVREGGSLLCFVRDPDGYRVEIIEKG